MEEFKYNKNRDASATINGFVYQVNVTIEKWISLNENEHLELEKGEDIDIVQKNIFLTDKVNQSRLLEQVKHRNSTIRLTSPEFIETLINFKEHEELNPLIELKLSFFTNSIIGKEIKSPLSKKNGVNVWNDIFHNKYYGFEEDNLADGIRTLITRGKPFSQNEKIKKWENWKDYILSLSSEEFKILIKKIEISHTNTTSNTFQSKLINDLTIITKNENESQILYYKLFSYVFNILSKKGEKYLTIKTFNDIKNNVSNIVDNKLIDKIKSFFDKNLSEINTGINSIKEDVSQNELRRQKDHQELKSIISQQNKKRIRTKLNKKNIKIAISFDNEDIVFSTKITELLINNQVSVFSDSKKLNSKIKDKSYFTNISKDYEIKSVDYCVVILSEEYHQNKWNKKRFCKILKFAYDNSIQIIPIKLGSTIKNIIGVTSFVKPIIAKTNEVEDTVENIFKKINASLEDNIRIQKEIDIEDVLKIYSQGDKVTKYSAKTDREYGYRLYTVKDELELKPTQHFLHIYRKSQLDIIHKKFSKDYSGVYNARKFIILMPKEKAQKNPEIRLNRFKKKFRIENAFYLDDFLWKISKIQKHTTNKVRNYIEPHLVNTFHIPTLNIFKNWLSIENNPVLFLTGIGGIGKTYLASKISEIFCQEPNTTEIFIKSDEIVQWLKSKENLDITVNLYEFYKAFYETTSNKNAISIEKFQVNLDNGNILLIIDGLEEISNRLKNFNVKLFLESIYNYTSEIKKRKVLITSRVNYSGILSSNLFFETIELDHFNEELTINYFLKNFEQDQSKMKQGLKLAKKFMRDEEKFIPFVLDVIQSIVKDENIIKTIELRSNILNKNIENDYIILNVFETEVIKTEQKLSTDQQVELFIRISNKKGEYKISDLKSDLIDIINTNNNDFIIEKLKVHPLLLIKNDIVHFRYDFLYDHFKNIYLGEFLKEKTEISDTIIQILSEKIKYNQQSTFDISKRIEKSDSDTIYYLIEIIEKLRNTITSKEKRRKVISGLFTIALQVKHNKINNKETNTELLVDIFGKPIKDLSIINLSTNGKGKIIFDFSNLVFENSYFHAYEDFWECKFDNVYFNENCEFHYLHKEDHIKIMNISNENFHPDCYIDTITQNILTQKQDKTKAEFEKAKNQFRDFCRIFYDRHYIKNKPIGFVKSKKPFSAKFVKLLEGELIEQHPVIKTDYKIIDKYKEEIRKFCERGNPITTDIMRFIKIINT